MNEDYFKRMQEIYKDKAMIACINLNDIRINQKRQLLKIELNDDPEQSIN